ncbi:MAG: TfoX/Sxy family protein [Candidatus Riflebacteria bacterium]|nr:TfoX/Sxy family protein [Candidatus Riflebacteria bacterium]
MASDTEFVEFIVDQLRDVKGVSCKKMFGEYAIYCGGKVVAMVCDNQLFVKPTAGGRAFIGEVVEGQPYPGAKPNFLIDGQFEDRDWLCELIRITTQELPEPKPKKKPAKTAAKAAPAGKAKK